MMTDPIGDMITRIRNAAVARHDATRMPGSKVKRAIAELLKTEGYVSDVRSEKWGKNEKKETLTIVLKYGHEREAAFAGLRRVSRPGRRVYVSYDAIPRVLSGLGTAILSTSQGMMTDKEARRRKLGGELMCEVW